MCNCPSCKLTDSYEGWIWNEEQQQRLPDPKCGGFNSWPEGEHIRRSGKDKVYTAHWKFCGAEAHKSYAKFDVRMHLGGRYWNLSSYAHLEHYKSYWLPVPESELLAA